MFHFIETVVDCNWGVLLAKKKRASQNKMTAADRVTWLLENLWSNNYSAMASDIGLSHTAVANVVRGLRQPGRRFLEAVSNHPKVNPAWLLTGQDEPLLAQRPDDGASGYLLPVATTLSAEKSSALAGAFSGDRYPVADSFFSPSRYWYKIGVNEVLLRESDLRIAVGDLLLMESNLEFFPTAPELDRRLGVVRMQSSEAEKFKIGQFVYQAESEEETETLSINCFAGGLDVRSLVSGFEIRIVGQEPPQVIPRKYQRDARHGTRKVPNIAFAPVLNQISKSDVVAVCVLMMRPFT